MGVDDQVDPLLATKLSLVTGLNTGMTYFGCVFVSRLGERFGYRVVEAAGIAIALFGASIPATFPDGPLVCWLLGYGLALGIGNSLIYISTFVVLEQSFERYFGVASAVVTAGSCLTYALYPFAYQEFIYMANGHSADEATPLGVTYNRT